MEGPARRNAGFRLHKTTLRKLKLYCAILDVPQALIVDTCINEQLDKRIRKMDSETQHIFKRIESLE